MKYANHALKNLFNYKDRACRKEFWLYLIVALILLILVFTILYVILMGYAGFTEKTLHSKMNTLSVIATVVFFGGIMVRRLHDVNVTGWVAFVCFFIPLVGLIFGFVPGTKGPNKYGAAPPAI
jgi:uncharacterized membrane protein YhaH (DUF805 family)